MGRTFTTYLGQVRAETAWGGGDGNGLRLADGRQTVVYSWRRSPHRENHGPQAALIIENTGYIQE